MRTLMTRLAQNLALAVAYAIGGGWGLLFASTPGNVTALWPPSGIALALLVRWGLGVAPGVFLGSFVTNLYFFPTSGPVTTATVLGPAVIAAGSTLGLSVAAVLIRRGSELMASPLGVTRFGMAVAAGAAIAATVGLVTTAVGGGMPPAAWVRFWWIWAIGDLMGMLALVPVVLDSERRRPRLLDWAGTVALTLILVQLVFGRPLPLPAVLPMPWVVLPGAWWAGVRLGPRGVVVQAVLVYMLASWATLAGLGPFAGLKDPLLWIDGVLVFVVGTGLMLAASATTSARSAAALAVERRTLEERVAERTALANREATDRARLYEALVEAQKQEAVGRLAGGVAHDFNNLLTVIRSEAGLLVADPTLAPPHADGVRTMLAATDRAAELTRQLLDVARRPLVARSTANVAEAVREVRSLARRFLPSNVVLDVWSLGPELFVPLEPIQLDQVLLNLVINARDALENGGKLRIHHEATVLAEGDPLGLPPGRYACVVVSDDGVGIPADVLGRIFEPFFTTKGGRGTGLGLSTTAGIVANAGGTIVAESAGGCGATFRVYLPAVAPKLPIVEAAPAPHGSTTGQTILVADDEALVRRVVARTLERAGHRVLVASDGGEALAVAEQHPEIALLVTDVVMPRMGGVELARAMRARGPIAVLMMSGYHEQQESLVGERLLAKPFGPEALLAAVDAALE